MQQWAPCLREEVPMVVANLKRMTTEYDEKEDRVRITGEADDGQALVMWITNRLGRRAVPGIVRWLDKDVPPSGVPLPGKGNALQSFAQEAAVASLNPQKPVAASPNAKKWLIQSIDIAATGRHMTLTFHGPPDQSAVIRFDATQLRQWLAILHRGWTQADWSPLVWPDWIKREDAPHQDTVIH
jgi:hypothetical protein